MSAVREIMQPGQLQGKVAPVLPIALLEAMRDHDRPREVLEDEDLAASLPRRLGLTGVIESQIQRYHEALRRHRSVPVEEVLDLLRLVLRRPDAEPILREAGAQVARHHFARLPAAAASALGVLPRPALAAALRRGTRTLLRRIAGTERPEVAGRPIAVRFAPSLTAAIDPSGAACVLYAAALEELAFLYLRERPRVEHSRCGARGEACCEWVLGG